MTAICHHPGRWWHGSPTGASSATSARATAGCTKASAARASCASAKATRWCSRPTAARPGFCIDPIEKKPLNHFYPGIVGVLVRHRRLQPRLQVLPELGHLEVARDGHADGRGVARGDRRRRAARLGCRSVAFTYNDPVIFAEYAMDTADACHALGITDGGGHRGLHRHAEPRREFYAKMDAANVDLKGFTDEFYVKLCGAHLQPVLDTLVYLKHETDVWFEITTLLIPGKNDSRRRDRGDERAGSCASSGPTCRCISPRSIPTTR